jgi:hypothetical protein
MTYILADARLGQKAEEIFVIKMPDGDFESVAGLL